MSSQIVGEMTLSDKQPWFEFRIEDTEGVGVEASKLSKLLLDISSAFYAIARAKLGSEATRRGRRTAEEDSLAAIRVVRVSPGSTVIEADPPTTGMQATLIPDDAPTAEDVLFDFALEAQRLDRGQRSSFSRPEIRRRVQAVLHDAYEIGPITEVVIRPRGRRRPEMQNDELRVRMAAAPAREAAHEPHAQSRSRRLTGHVFMVDVEPGRFRLRLKVPDGRDLTLDTAASLAPLLGGAVDQAVEVEALEELEGDQVTNRTAVSVALLPSSGDGSDKPPKSVEVLEREQGLTEARPDYTTLANAVWSTEEAIAEFDEYLMQVRQAASL